MKGIVFTEFLEFSEQRFGAAAVDRVIMAADLPHGGAYTAVGTYDHRELVTILGRLSHEISTPAPVLLQEFGTYLFGVLALAYPALIQPSKDAFALLASIEGVIHFEVCKLYPDAQLPRFTYEQFGPDRMILNYNSERSFADLAEGLLRGCFAHFGERVRIEREDLSGGAGTQVRFTLSRE